MMEMCNIHIYEIRPHSTMKSGWCPYIVRFDKIRRNPSEKDITALTRDLQTSDNFRIMKYVEYATPHMEKLGKVAYACWVGNNVPDDVRIAKE